MHSIYSLKVYKSLENLLSSLITLTNISSFKFQLIFYSNSALVVTFQQIETAHIENKDKDLFKNYLYLIRLCTPPNPLKQLQKKKKFKYEYTINAIP